jgi:16S rRNA (cytidine1402-2'-O)-methyltransferase
MDKERLNQAGTLEPALYLVSTPIGNLEDVTRRAERILKNVDLILAEDTRHSRRLLDHLGIKNRMESFHDFNKEKKTPAYVRYLREKRSIALISDAGTPGIADPGFYLVRAVRRAGLKVTAVPGPCAFITALSVSGMPTDHFCFGNFPPAKSAQRIRQLEQYREMYLKGKTKAPTIGYYIGPKKLKKFLHEIAQVFGQSLRIVLARELTKKFEEVLAKTAAEHISYYAERAPRGEFVLLFHPQNKGI